MNYTPKDIIKIIAIIGAFIMFGVGALMMWNGVSAEGTIDLKSPFLTGSLKTGSAGLFISFLSFFIISLVVFSLGEKEQKQHAKNSPPSKKILQMFWGLLTLTTISGTLAALGFGSLFVGLSVGLGFLLFVVVIALLAFLENE